MSTRMTKMEEIKMLDKTVDVYKNGVYKGSSAYSTNISFYDLILTYMEKTEFDKVIIRQWENCKEIKTNTINFYK